MTIPLILCLSLWFLSTGLTSFDYDDSAVRKTAHKMELIKQ